MPLPDSEAPDRSLGDCSICMDAIMLEAPPRRSLSEKAGVDEPGAELEGASAGAAGGLWDAMQANVGMKAARKNYSLAPCSHLFVRILSPCPGVCRLNDPSSILPVWRSG